MSGSIEMVSFKLNNGVSDEAFLSASQKIEGWVGKQPGFEYRALAKQQDGTWVDLVFWQNEAAAQAAGEKFMQASEPQEMMACIDKDTVIMQHMPVMAALCMEAAVEAAKTATA